jgi:hypothetical protein
MQIIQNVVSPSSRGDAVLSQGLKQQGHELLASELDACDELHNRPHIRQQRRVRQRGLVEHGPFQTQFDLLRQGDRRRRFVGQRRGGNRILRRRAVDGRRTALAAGIETALLLSSRVRLIVGDTPLAGSLLTMLFPAAERTTQVCAARVPGMGEKTNPAVHAGNDAILQLGMGFDGTVQRDQILLNHRPGAIVLMPIRPKREELPDGDNKKAKLSVTIPMSLHTPSSYLTEAHASRGRARFFCARKAARANRRNQRPRPHRPPSSVLQPQRRRAPGDLKRLLGKRNPLLLSK